MNVLVVPTGSSGPSRALVPRIADVFRTSGPNVRVRALLDASASRDSEHERAALADAVERYSGSVQVYVRCLADDLHSLAALAQADVLVRRRAFWGVDAWRNLGLWIRERLDPEEPSWRAGLRSELEEVVRDAEHGPAASLIDIASRGWLIRHCLPMDDEEEQRRLQAQVAPLIGSINGGDPNRAEEASQRVRDILGGGRV